MYTMVSACFGRGARRLAVIASMFVIAIGLLPSSAANAEVVSPLSLRYSAELYGDFLTVGNTVMECPAGNAACAGAAAGTGPGNNNAFRMQRTDAGGLPGLLDSSTATVAIPPGATVRHARLFWGGNTGKYRHSSGTMLNRCDVSDTANATLPAGDPLSTSVSVRVGATGSLSTVPPANAVATTATSNGPHYYSAEGDITGLFAGALTGTPVQVAVGNVWAPEGLGCVGGWSLTVVYGYDQPNPTFAPVRRAVYVWGGHVLQRSGDPDTTVDISGFYAVDSAPIRGSVTAYEGDSDAPGDQLRVNGRNIPEPQTGATTNFFNGRVDGNESPNDVNSLGFDAKAFQVPAGVIADGATSAQLTLRTTSDTYVVAQLAFSVPVPDILVSKTAAATTVEPGDTLEYTITIENIGGVAYPGAQVVDDLTATLDDAEYLNNASADSGVVAYAEPELTWTGTVAVGQTVTLRYSVRIGPAGAGDGVLRNAVEVSSGSNCDADSTDPACRNEVTVSDASPSPSVSPSASTSPTASAAPSASTAPTASPTGGASLPVTGASVLPMLIPAFALVVAGAVIVMVARRRRRA